MPMISKSDLGGQEVKPGDEVKFKVASINGDQIELSYDNVDVEHEMSMDEMNDPMKVDKMDSMSSDQMKKVLPKKLY